jgi:hypothetical protein
MTLVEVLLSDSYRSLRGQVAPAFARAIAASLSANPTTLAELDLALGRFVKRTGERSLLEDFYPIVPDLPTAAAANISDSPTVGPTAPSAAESGVSAVSAVSAESGESRESGETVFDGEREVVPITRLPAEAVPAEGVLIDLPGRVVVAQNAGFSVESSGTVTYVEDNPDRKVVTRYRLGPTWTVLPAGFAADRIQQAGSIANAWKQLVSQQRNVRESLLRVDDQGVLYDRLVEFLAESLLSDRFRDSDDPIRDIHAEWLLTPRADLFGACPRDLLIGRIEEVEQEISVREWEWTVLNARPEPLPAESEAVRESGHGPHEYAIYYHLIRYLLAEAWSLIDDREHFTVTSLAAMLRKWRDEWLDRPDYDHVPNCTARWLIEQERRRIPWLVEEHDQFHDPDCPICRWSKELKTPSFHQISASHEEEGFAFSLCDTEEEWAELMRGFEDFNEPATERKPSSVGANAADHERPDREHSGSRGGGGGGGGAEDEEKEKDDLDDEEHGDLLSHQRIVRTVIANATPAAIPTETTVGPNTGKPADSAVGSAVGQAGSVPTATLAGTAIAGAMPANRRTPRPMAPDLELMEPAQQVTVWHLRLVLLLIDIRDQAGRGPDRESAEQALRRLHEFRDAVREHEGWLAEQYLNEVGEQVEALGARRLDLAPMCHEFDGELAQMRRASQAAMRL